MTPDRRAGRPAPAGQAGHAICRHHASDTAHRRTSPSRPWVPEALAEGNTLRRLVYGLAAQRLPGWLAGYSTGGMPLPDEFDRLARRHLDGQIGFLYRDAADTADQVADVEQEPELPGRPLGDLVQAL